MLSITVLELLNVWAIQNGKETSSFFDNMNIDVRIDKKILFSEFIRIYGNDYPIYNNSFEFYNFICDWFSSRNGFKDIADVLTIDYNPIHNYDRTETRTKGDSWKEENNNLVSNEEKVSAYNSNDYQPSNLATNNSKQETSGNKSENETVKTSGNIGVTTTQQMIEAEISMRLNRNLIEIVVRELGSAFTWGVY